MKNTRKHIQRAGVVLCAALVAGAAQAHTGHETSSFMSGLMHPLSGFDHVLAMLAVGLLAKGQSRNAAVAAPYPQGLAGYSGLIMPILFVGMLLVSAGIGALGFAPPVYLEMLIAASIVALGAIALAGPALPVGLGLSLVAFAGIAHGWAHGAEIADAGFAAYALGFVATTVALHGAGYALGAKLVAGRQWLWRSAAWLLMASGSLYAALAASY